MFHFYSKSSMPFRVRRARPARGKFNHMIGILITLLVVAALWAGSRVMKSINQP